MSQFSPAGKQEMLEALAAVVTQLSLHDGDPGTTGANELTGGSPAYARKAVTFGAFDTVDSIPLGADVTFDVPAGATVAYVGFWESTTFHGYATLADPEVFAGQGEYTVLDTTVMQITNPA